MKKMILIILMVIPVYSYSQFSARERLNVFVDCSNTWCDMTFIRSEITAVNFSLDRIAADIHVLITSAQAGGGGDQYNVIFYGQNKYKGLNDTLRFIVSPIATDFESRDILVKYIKLGLAPSVAKTKAIEEISIVMKSDSVSGKSNQTVTDSWNYWVYRIGFDGSFSADQVYTSTWLNGSFSANRTTEREKINFRIGGGIDRSKYTYDGETDLVHNYNYRASHFHIWSIGKKWGAGYETVYSSSTFSNNKGRAFLRTGIEYNLFPYTDVNNKLLTISYGPFIQHNSYYDTTIFNKKRELISGHMLLTSLTLNQKWGSIGFGVAYRNYFHNWKFYNLGANANMNIRITGGLSFYVDFWGSLAHDQIFLSADGVDKEDVLTKRRQLGSNFNFRSWFGLTYRFGSILNNFVNPRFDGPGNWIF
jgi:hypothetical protein